MRIPLFLLVAGIVFAMTGVRADTCTPGDDLGTVTTPATGVDITLHGGSGIYYLKKDACEPDCITSIWIYEESNGYAGIQRADPMVDDTCGGTITPDTLVAAVYVA